MNKSHAPVPVTSGGFQLNARFPWHRFGGSNPLAQKETAVVALGRANHVALVDVATRKVRAYVPVGKRVWHVAVSPDGARAFAANGLSDNVSVIDLAAGKVVGTVAVGAGPWGIAVAP